MRHRIGNRRGRLRQRYWPWGALAGLALAVSGGAAQAAQAATQAGCGGIWTQLALVVLMLTLSCAVHALVSVLQAELTRRGKLARWCGPHSSGRLLLIVTMALFTGLALMVEILLWALLYHRLGLFPGLEGSLYFSGITFTTVGYGDMTLPACWRLLSVGEAVNGVLMAGWSTAQLITVVQQMMELRLQAEGWIQADPQQTDRDRGFPGGTTR